MSPVDPWQTLGVRPNAPAVEVRAAYRALALRHHPDAGGSDEAMAELNRAYEIAIQGVGPAGPRLTSARRVQRDVASFTYDELPVVAFENLLVVAGILGDVAEEEPPYLLEFVIREAGGAWCRCELVPDAGSTTVSVTVATEDPAPLLGVETVRDLLVAELNALELPANG